MADDSQYNKKRLIAALARPRSERPSSESDRREFDDLRHTLNSLIERISRPETEHSEEEDRNLLRNLILECSPRAALLHNVMVRLGEAERRLADMRSDLAIPILHSIRDELAALEDAPRQFVYELCKDHRGPFEAPLFTLHTWDIIDHKTPASPFLLFDLGELRMAVAALRANARRAAKSGEHYCLTYREWPSFAEIMWLEQIPRRTDGNGTEENIWKDYVDAADDAAAINAMINAAKASLKTKVLYRGLPQVILFAIENRAKHVSLLHKSKWHELWETATTKDEGRVQAALSASDADWSSWIKQAMPKGCTWVPNYGWRFIFINTANQAEPPQKETAQEPSTIRSSDEGGAKHKRRVFLCDDRQDAEWLKNVKDKLEQRLGATSVHVLNGCGNAQNAQTLIAQWADKIDKNRNGQKCDVVTDSEFSVNDTLSDGGERLLVELANRGVLYRGIVYSDAPSFTEQNWANQADSGKAVCKAIRKSTNLDEDAQRIDRFIETGRLDPLGGMIAMIQRLVSIISPLLETTDAPPWSLLKDHIDDDEQWRVNLDPWRILKESFGFDIPVPFSSTTWKYFIDSPRYGVGFRAELLQRIPFLNSSGVVLGDFFAERVRSCLCPVESVINIVEASNFPRSWEGKSPIGALRVLIDLCTEPDDFDQPDNKWISVRTAQISHRDVALKYAYYLRRYRRECLLRLTRVDFVNIKSAVRCQVEGLQSFLLKWEEGAL